MPPLADFSNNPLQTHADLHHAALALLVPLPQYFSPHKARIKLASATGAGFSETAAQLEGFARPLWIVPNLLRLDEAAASDSVHSVTAHLRDWIEGLKVGTDPSSAEYWGDVFGFDQRMVEMESIAYALLAHPAAFRFADDQDPKARLITWLRQINAHPMPKSNWLWFRVLVNLALVKTLDVPLDEVKSHIDESLQTLDTFYIADGWNSDGLWCEERRQADYYSGSFAIQFAQLLFVRFAPEYDPDRTERYKDQAKLFATEYWRYFAPNGPAIPFGRSLAYRFSMGAFWAAVSLAEVDLPSPLNDVGTVKGMLLRHLRWWTDQPHIFNTDGTPNIGYVYPNTNLAEDYTSPQSAYWCLKAFLVLGLDANHVFWTSEELPHPQVQDSLSLQKVKLLKPPRHMMCNTPEHHFLLSSGQYTTKRFKAREAKYGKFAYSSGFGFSVTSGSHLEQIAPDSTLALAFEDGDELQWKVRWNQYDVQHATISVGEESVPILTSHWTPWKREALVVKTTLIPPLQRFPGWSYRVHEIEWTPRDESDLMVFDGGFAISAQIKAGVSLFEKPVGTDPEANDGENEGWWNDNRRSLVISESGSSGIIDLTPPDRGEETRTAESATVIIRADPNTNLNAQRTLIPGSQHRIKGVMAASDPQRRMRFLSGVFAVHASSGLDADAVWGMWRNRPTHELLVDSLKTSAETGNL